MTTFNASNENYRSGKYNLFLGGQLSIHDTVNVTYPEVEKIFHDLKSIDWVETEVDLSQDRMDYRQAPKEITDLMIKNLAYQCDLDSVASRAIAPLFAPMVTNPELWRVWSYISSNECLHAATYSEIVRQCFTKPEEFFDECLHNEQVLDRNNKFVEVFDQLEVLGAKYKLGMVTDKDEIMKTCILGVCTLYFLERVSFMASFACSFALAEINLFQGSAKLIQKILNDELLHFKLGEELIDILTKEYPALVAEIMPKIREVGLGILEQERTWNEYIFSEGRKVVGLTKPLLDDWLMFCMRTPNELFNMELDCPDTNPLPFMENWVDMDKFQSANQEIDNTAYKLNVIKDDFGDTEFDIDF